MYERRQEQCKGEERPWGDVRAGHPAAAVTLGLATAPPAAEDEKRERQRSCLPVPAKAMT